LKIGERNALNVVAPIPIDKGVFGIATIAEKSGKLIFVGIFSWN